MASGIGPGARRRVRSRTSITGPTALAVLATRLRCPNCGASLALVERALACARGHRFDVARQGHVALPAPGRRIPRGDPPAMVAAREAFLAAGHYAPIAAALDAAARAAVEPTADRARSVVDLGAGTGHHLAALLGRRPGWWGVALDASASALRRAVRAHPRIAAVACDVWRGLPLQDAAADLVVNVFAPRNGPEIARVLAPDGALVVVTPTARHLHELVSALGLLGVDPDKRARVRAALSGVLEPVDRRAVAFDLALGHRDVQALVAMGPSAHHLDPGDLRRRLARLPDPVGVTASVEVETLRPATSPRSPRRPRPRRDTAPPRGG